MNYTKPDDENHIDKPEDWLFTSLTFGFALSHLIPEGHGIIVDLKNDTQNIFSDITRVIVFNDGKMMRIINGEDRDDLENGTMVKMVNGDNIIN